MLFFYFIIRMRKDDFVSSLDQNSKNILNQVQPQDKKNLAGAISNWSISAYLSYKLKNTQNQQDKQKLIKSHDKYVGIAQKQFTALSSQGQKTFAGLNLPQMPPKKRAHLQFQMKDYLKPQDSNQNRSNQTQSKNNYVPKYVRGLKPYEGYLLAKAINTKTTQNYFNGKGNNPAKAKKLGQISSHYQGKLGSDAKKKFDYLSKQSYFGKLSYGAYKYSHAFAQNHFKNNSQQQQSTSQTQAHHKQYSSNINDYFNGLGDLDKFNLAQSVHALGNKNYVNWKKQHDPQSKIAQNSAKMLKWDKIDLQQTKFMSKPAKQVFNKLKQSPYHISKLGYSSFKYLRANRNHVINLMKQKHVQNQKQQAQSQSNQQTITSQPDYASNQAQKVWQSNINEAANEAAIAAHRAQNQSASQNTPVQNKPNSVQSSASQSSSVNTQTQQQAQSQSSNTQDQSMVSHEASSNKSQTSKASRSNVANSVSSNNSAQSTKQQDWIKKGNKSFSQLSTLIPKGERLNTSKALLGGSTSMLLPSNSKKGALYQATGKHYYQGLSKTSRYMTRFILKFAANENLLHTLQNRTKHTVLNAKQQTTSVHSAPQHQKKQKPLYNTQTHHTSHQKNPKLRIQTYLKQVDAKDQFNLASAISTQGNMNYFNQKRIQNPADSKANAKVNKDSKRLHYATKYMSNDSLQVFKNLKKQPKLLNKVHWSAFAYTKHHYQEHEQKIHQLWQKKHQRNATQNVKPQRSPESKQPKHHTQPQTVNNNHISSNVIANAKEPKQMQSFLFNYSHYYQQEQSYVPKFLQNISNPQSQKLIASGMVDNQKYQKTHYAADAKKVLSDAKQLKQADPDNYKKLGKLTSSLSSSQKQALAKSSKEFLAKSKTHAPFAVKNLHHQAKIEYNYLQSEDKELFKNSFHANPKKVIKQGLKIIPGVKQSFKPSDRSSFSQGNTQSTQQKSIKQSQKTQGGIKKDFHI